MSCYGSSAHEAMDKAKAVLDGRQEAEIAKERARLKKKAKDDE